MDSLTARGIDIVLLDHSAAADRRLLYHRESQSQPAGREPWTLEEALQPPGLGLAETIQVGDREWLFACRPGIGYVAARQTWTAFVALIGGLLLSGSLAGIFLTALRRESEATRHARELLGAKEELEREAEEREQARAELAVGELRFRQLVENMSSGVAVYEAVDDGADFIFRDYNAAAERMDGISREEVLGKRLTVAFPGAEEMGLLGLFQTVWRTGKAQNLPSARYQDERLEGWRENYAYRLPSGEVVAIYDDITEQKRLEADFLHSQKMEAIGRLAGGIAHDFNNLLQVVAGSCDLLLGDKYDAAEQEKMLRDVRLQAERGAQLVRRLLVFSRRESQVTALIDLGDVIRSAETLMLRLLKANIELAVDLADTPLPITGDQGQLEQVLMNLVVNAADAMPEGGGLRIRSGAEGASEVWFSVADTGPGIAVESVDKVFDPYFTTKSAAQGTGLGLAVVDGIVSLHQGRIEVDNRPGEGVTFKVLLPRSERPSEVSRPQSTASSALKGNRERLLVVEDQDPVRAVMKTMLNSLRYEVTTAADGAAARQCAAAGDFDLLISDIVLPDTTGVELAEELRLQRPAMGVLLVSGYVEESVRQRASDIRFLQKPFRLADLAQQVAAALRERSDRTE